MSLRAALPQILLLLTRSCVLFAALLLAVEMGLRVLAPLPEPGRSITSFLRPRQGLGWSLKSGEQGKLRVLSGKDAYREIPIAIDEKGLRVFEQQKRDEAPFQVLLAGGSEVFGVGVHHREVFSSQLAALNPSVKVTNIGVPGYTIDQSLIALTEKVRKERFDVAILSVAKLLPEQQFARFQRPQFSRRAESLIVQTIGRELPGESLPADSFLDALLVKRYANNWFEIESESEAARDLAVPIDAEALRLMINRFVQIAAGRQLVPVILLIPHSVAASQPAKYQQVVARHCTLDTFCHLVDVYPAFKKASPKMDALFLHEQTQLSDVGHMLVARELERFFRKLRAET